MTALQGRRVVLRPLVVADFRRWQEVRRRNAGWLTKWEPQRVPGQPDPVESRDAFSVRCSARARERQLGTGFGFGVFCGPDFVGEINLSSVQRGPFQSGHVGYWIDERFAGESLCPEGLVVLLRYSFEELGLHRLQMSIIPRNGASRRVMEKLEIRNEGLAERYLEIDGIWEDHLRFAMTSEEWAVRGPSLIEAWVS